MRTDKSLSYALTHFFFIFTVTGSLMFVLCGGTICACFVGRPLWRLWHATNESPSSVEGAEAEVEVEAEVEEVPFAQATLISSEEAVMYETAAAVVASSAV